MAWSGQGEEYFALDGRNLATRGVVLWNAADNTQQLLYRHPDIDIESFSLDPTGRPWMLAGTGHFPFYWYPDREHPLARLHQSLTQRLPREQIDIVSSTDDYSIAVARISSGARVPTYLIVDGNSGRIGSSNGLLHVAFSSWSGPYVGTALTDARLESANPTSRAVARRPGRAVASMQQGSTAD